MRRLGKHFIIELYDCDKTVINDLKAVENHLLEAAKLSGATIIRPLFHKFPPKGISGIVVVAESHFSIHTWPEFGYCALDIFTCSEQIKGQKALSYLKEHLMAKTSSITVLERGPAVQS